MSKMIGILIPEDWHRSLRGIAKRKGKKISEVGRDALLEYLLIHRKESAPLSEPGAVGRPSKEREDVGVITEKG